MKKPAQGLTLIELIVAIAIFALLGLMSYRAIYSATENQHRLSEEFSDWQRISRALNRVESELMQIGIRAIGVPNKNPALMVSPTSNGGIRLIYWRMDATQGARLSGLEYANEKLSLLRWKTADATQEPTRDVLLEDIQNLSWQYAVKGDSTWRESWSASDSSAADVPEGVRLVIELRKKGRISRVFALR